MNEPEPEGVPEFEVFTLPGLDAESAPLTIAGVTLTRLDFEFWIMLEKTQFAEDLTGTMLQRPPLFAVFGSMAGNAPEPIAAARSQRREFALRRLTRALWLLRPESFPDPLSYIVYRRMGTLNVRDPKRYGRSAYEMHVKHAISVSEATDLEAIATALGELDQRRYVQIDLALNLLGYSHDPGLMGPLDRLLVLLGALDALAGETWYRLEEAAWPDPATNQFLKRYRRTRDRAAHGKGRADMGTVDALRVVIRVLLREAIALALDRNAPHECVGRSLIERVRELADLGPARLIDKGTRIANQARCAMP